MHFAKLLYIFRTFLSSKDGGKVIIVSYNDKEFKANFQDVLINEKEIIGTRASNKQDLIEVVRLVEQGKVTPYVSNTFPLNDIN